MSLVGEAKQDKDLITAVEVGSEFDPKGERSIHIYTTFDNFDTEEWKYRAISWIHGRFNRKKSEFNNIFCLLRTVLGNDMWF